jgi:hypothetical protein
VHNRLRRGSLVGVELGECTTAFAAGLWVGVELGECTTAFAAGLWVGVELGECTTAFAVGLWVGVGLGECLSREGGEGVSAHINGSQHKEMFILADQ